MSLKNSYMYTHADTDIPRSSAPKRPDRKLFNLFYESAIALYFRELKCSRIAMCIDLTVF